MLGRRFRRPGADHPALRRARRRRRRRADRPGRRLRLRLLEARRDVRPHQSPRRSGTPTATWSSRECGSSRPRSGRSTRCGAGSRRTPAPFDADVLVVALGADLDPAATPGLVEAGHEFYTVAGRLRRRATCWPHFDGGRVIVGVTSTPFKCPPAPSETALLHARLPRRARAAGRQRDLAGHAARRADPAVAGGVGGAAGGVRRAGHRLAPGPAGARARPGPPGRGPRRRRARCRTTCSSACRCTGRRRSWRSRACASTAGSRSTRSRSRRLTPTSTRSATSPASARPRRECSPRGRPRSSPISSSPGTAQTGTARAYDGTGHLLPRVRARPGRPRRGHLPQRRAPDGRFDEPSALLLADKAEFGTSRIRRWFGRDWSSY